MRTKLPLNVGYHRTFSAGKITICLIVVWIIIALFSPGCAKVIDLSADDSFRTPIPRSTIDAYPTGQPVITKLEAVVATNKSGLLGFHREWVTKPEAIFAEKMDYEEALKRIGDKDSLRTTEFAQSNTPVWLVVFTGELRYVEPLGTLSAPFTGCSYVMVRAEDGQGLGAGGRPCEEMNLEK